MITAIHIRIVVALLLASPAFAQSLPGDAVIAAGVVFEAGISQPTSGAGKPHFQLRNPAGSGRLVLVDMISTSNVGRAGYWTIRSYPPPLATQFTKSCNARFGGAPPHAEVYYQKSASVLGNLHAEWHNGADVTYDMPNTGYPLVQLGEGRAVLAVFHSGDTATVVNFRWREIATGPASSAARSTACSR